MNVLLDAIELPWLLTLAVVLPLLFYFLLRRARAERARRLQRLGNLEVVRRLVPPNVLAASGWRGVRLGTAALLAGIAIAGPRWGLERTTVRSTGVDLVLAVDASLSMLATDERPSRLERVKQEIRRLRALSPGDRVGLLAFAGRSYVLSPITVDGGALDLFLDNLDPSVVGQAGSSIAQTIAQGTSLLALTKSGADRALVIMSDGEAFEPQDEILASARRAKEQGVSLVTVGFGSIQGSTIPIREGNRVIQKRDEKGEVVVTHYKPEVLQAAAAAAGGTFIPAEATDKAARIKSALARLRTKSRATLGGEDRTPRYQWFLLPAVLLLWLDTLLGGRKGRRRRQAAAAETAVAASIALVLLTACGGSQEAVDASAAYRAKNYQRAANLFAEAVRAGDRSPGALYNYGTALIAADSLAAAAEVLERAVERADPEVRYRGRFNGGYTHLVRGLAKAQDSSGAPPSDSASAQLKLALADYKRVLIQQPTDLDAKWNYELALEKEKQGGGGGGGGGQSNASEAPAENKPKPQPTLAQRQAEQLLGSAEREEREVQGKKQKQNRPEPPPGGKDW
ncbi:MAG TPA: VWA domain-containing protein [Gemmatimonadaceae bacterium]|nr:VWA domain-containing protein [Gemmatimonadaceae bacterium]